MGPSRPRNSTRARRAHPPQKPRCTPAHKPQPPQLLDLESIPAILAEARGLIESAHAVVSQRPDTGPELTALRVGLETFQRAYNALDRADQQLSAGSRA